MYKHEKSLIFQGIELIFKTDTLRKLHLTVLIRTINILKSNHKVCHVYTIKLIQIHSNFTKETLIDLFHVGFELIFKTMLVSYTNLFFVSI